MDRTVDELLNDWETGNVTIEDADEVVGPNGHTIEATFHCDDGDLTLTYSLDDKATFQPNESDAEATPRYLLAD